MMEFGDVLHLMQSQFSGEEATAKNAGTTNSERTHRD